MVNWAQRKFTRAGLAVLGGVMLGGLMGIDTENTVAYQGFTLLVCLLTISLVFSWLFRAKFGAARRLPRFGTAGQGFEYRIVVQNLSPALQGGLTVLENLVNPEPTYQDWRSVQRADERRSRSFRISEGRRTNPFKLAMLKEAPLSPVPPGGEAAVRMAITPLRRGVLEFGNLTVARTDPLGLFRALIKVNVPRETVLVLPRRYPLPAIALPGTIKYQEQGVALASNVGQSDEFVSLRDYRRGDPLRHIHWRSWAKAGKPIVKEFEDEFFVRHALVLDTFSDDPHGDVFEEAVSLAASFACTIPSQESLLDLLFIGREAYCFTAGRGLAHADQMLEVLAAVRAGPEAGFSGLERLVLDHAAVVSGCIFVLQAWDTDRQRLVEKLKVMRVPVRVFVIVAEDEEAALEPGPMRDEPDRFHVLRAGHVEEGLAKV
jgi:uncharacterized protein (DUF58 family)